MNKMVRWCGGIVALSGLLVFFAGCDDGGGGPAPTVDVTGRWEGTSGGGQAFTFDLVQTGASVSGTTTAGAYTAEVAGSVEGNRVEFTILWPDIEETVSADVTGNTLSGTVRQEDIEVPFSATRS